MAPPDPLQLAASAYTADRWDDDDWRQFGRETGTSDIINGHPRLYRSLSFGDPDYPDATMGVLGEILAEASDPKAREAGRMELLAGAMPELRLWVSESAPVRIRRLFESYLAERDSSEIPEVWRDGFEDVDPSPAPKKSLKSLRFAEQPGRVASTAPGTESAARPEAGAIALGATTTTPKRADERAIFIVHGHDEAARDSIRVFVQRITGVMPISLAEEPAKGRTIIEKFEAVGGVAAYVIVLLSPDDVGQTTEGHRLNEEPSPRARQNVVMELGYFIGKIGRSKIAVMDADVERPSDIAGLNYIAYPGQNWKEDLRVELSAAGLVV